MKTLLSFLLLLLLLPLTAQAQTLPLVDPDAFFAPPPSVNQEEAVNPEEAPAPVPLADPELILVDPEDEPELSDQAETVGSEQQERPGINDSSREDYRSSLILTSEQYRAQSNDREIRDRIREEHPFLSTAVIAAAIPTFLTYRFIYLGIQTVHRYILGGNAPLNSYNSDSRHRDARLAQFSTSLGLLYLLSSYPRLMLSGYLASFALWSLDAVMDSSPITRLYNNNRFITYLSHEPNLFTFTSLPEALAFINVSAGLEGSAPGTVGPEPDNLILFLQTEEQSDLLQFLNQLVNTDEFNQSHGARSSVARRIINILFQALNNQEFRLEALTLIHNSVTACNDHALLALSHLEAHIFLCEVEKTISETRSRRYAERYLRESARRMFFFDEIRRYSRHFHDSQPNPPEGGHIEVENVFHVLLQDSPDYPLPTTIRGVHDASKATLPLITPQDIEDLKRYLDTVFNERFEEYLTSWQPWRQYQRSLSVIPYDDLPTVSSVRNDDICPILQSEPVNPVLLNGRVYDYSELRKWYVMKGTDPVTRQNMHWKDVYKPAYTNSAF